MVLRLIESKRKRSSRRVFGVGMMSLAIHSALISGVVYATLHAAPSEDHVRMDTTVVLLAPQEQQKPAEAPLLQLVDALRGFQTVAVPAEIPTDIPPVDLQQRFDPKDYSGTGVEGGLSTGMVPTGNEVFMEAIVEEKTAVLSGPPPWCSRPARSCAA